LSPSTSVLFFFSLVDFLLVIFCSNQKVCPGQLQ
jgi:hypothetical protein